MEPGATLHMTAVSMINKHAVGKGWQNVAIQPGSQGEALGGIAPFEKENPSFHLQINRYGRREENMSRAGEGWSRLIDL